jgi:hypothetical protein
MSKSLNHFFYSEHESTSTNKKAKDSGPNGAPSFNSSAYNYQGYSSSSSAYPQASQWSGNYNYDYNQYTTATYGNYNQPSYY